MRVTLIGAVSLLGMVSACMTTATLHLDEMPIEDRTVPTSTPYRIASIMVLPPQDRKSEDPELVELERALLESGMTIISPAVTGRVVRDAERTQAAEAKSLPYVERALVLARQSNADALLQLIEVGWKDSYRPFRWDGSRFDEVDSDTELGSATLVRVSERRFTVRGRLIDVMNGRVIMSLDLSQSTSKVVERTRVLELQDQEISVDSAERRQAVIAQLVSSFVTKLRAAPPRASHPVAAEPSAAPTSAIVPLDRPQ